MAYKIEQWNEARFLWEIDKPLSYIVEKTGISKAQISKKSTKEQWKKETVANKLKPLIKDLDKQKETIKETENKIVSKLATLKDYEITLLDSVIQDETGNKSLLFSTVNLAIIRANQQLTKNTKQVIEYETIYSEGKPIKKSPINIETELNSADIKNHIDAIDKASLTLGVSQRHSNSQVSIQNTNATQNNIPITIEWE